MCLDLIFSSTGEHRLSHTLLLSLLMLVLYVDLLREMKALGYTCQFTVKMAGVGPLDIAEMLRQVKTKL